MSTLVSIAQEHIITCTTWCASKGLSISQVKSQIIMFSRKKKLNLPRPLKVNGIPTPFVTKATYLGVTLDHKLSWIPHITAVSAKATANLFACKKAVGSSWGLSPKILRFIYAAIVRPSLAYAAVCWFHRSHLSAASSLLRKPQRLATLMITRAFPSSYAEGLDIICGLQPIQDFVLSEALKSRAALLSCKRWIPHPSPSSHAALINSTASPIAELAMPHDAIIPLLSLDLPFSITIASRESVAEFSFTAPDHLYIFTDGSRCNDLSGSGMVCLLNDSFFAHSSLSLGSYPTVFQAELLAINMACYFILASTSPPSSVSIHSDSQAALSAIAAPVIKSSSVMSCISDLSAASNVCTSLSLHWIPGHSGFQGNDIADEQARLGSSSIPIGPAPFLPLSRASINSAIKSWISSVTFNRLSSANISTKSSVPLLAILSSPPKGLNPLPELSILKPYSQLISGHSYLNYFQHRTGIISSPLCPACREEAETTEHFLCLCPALSCLRQTHFGISSMPISYLASTFSPSSIIAYVRKSGRSLDRPPSDA